MQRSTKLWESKPGFSKYFRPSKSLGYEYEPNSMIGTNSLGMLDRERAGEKPEGVYRIICLGDSTTANSEYVSNLEKLLNENKNDRRFEVWNCGVSAYGVFQYCHALKEKWLHYDPDMVIIGFCLNDFETTPLVIRESDHLVGYFPYKEILSEINPFLFEHSAFYRFIIARLFVFKKWDRNGDIFEISRSHLKDVKDLLSERKIGFLIVIFGLVDKLEDYPSWMQNYKRIKAIIKDYNIKSIDMIPIFEANGPENLRLFENDEFHFNNKGSQVIAETIYAYLTE